MSKCKAYPKKAKDVAQTCIDRVAQRMGHTFYILRVKVESSSQAERRARCFRKLREFFQDIVFSQCNTYAHPERF